MWAPESVRPGTTTCRTPHGDIRPAHGFHEVPGPPDVTAGEGVIAVRIFMLDVKQHKVGVGQNFLIIAAPGSGGIQAGVNAVFLEPPQHLGKKFRLHQRLSAEKVTPPPLAK